MSVISTSPNALLKEWYDTQTLEQALFTDQRFFRRLKQKNNQNLGGKYVPLPVNYAPSYGGGGSWTAARQQAVQNQDSSVEFQVVPVANSYFTVLPGALIAQTDDAKGGWLPLATKRIDDQLNAIARRISSQMWRSGYGDVGQVASGLGVTGSGTGAATNQFKLTNITDIINIKAGDVLTFGSTQTGASRTVGASIATAQGIAVTGVDQSTGTVTVSGNLVDGTTGISGVSVSDYVFMAGDKAAAGTGGQIITGLEGWCPAGGATSGDSFFGVNRTVDNALCGTSYAAPNGMALETVIRKGVAKACDLGGKITEVWCNNNTFTELGESLGTRVRYNSTDLIHRPTFGPLDGIELGAGNDGTVMVYCDSTVPANRIWGINPESIEFRVAGNGFAPDERDDVFMLRSPDLNGDYFTIQWMLYCAFMVPRPLDLLNIQITPVA